MDFMFLGFIAFGVILALGMGKFIISTYKVCSADQILVKTGKLFGAKEGEVAQVFHGGATFVIPFIQQYATLSVSPFTVDVNLQKALTKENIRVNLPSNFTLRISVDPAIMPNAARSLISLDDEAISAQAYEIIVGQFRAVVANMTINQINQDREQFLNLVEQNVNTELNKIGIEIVNVNITDIKDEAGYLDALGKKAVTEAKQKAEIDIANAEKDGSIGVNEAQKEREIEVSRRQTEKATGIAETEAERRKQVAMIEATTLEAENLSKAKQIEANTVLREKNAEATQRVEVANAEAQAKIIRSQKEVEQAKLEKETLVNQEIENRKAQLMVEQETSIIMKRAQAKADALMLEKEAEAKSILMVKEAEAKGLQAMLNAQANGYKELFETVGDNKHLIPTMEMVKIMPDLVKAQADAISNIEFGKVTVWDNGSGQTANNFLQGITNSLPSIHSFAKQAGVQLPEFLGTMQEEKEEDKKGTVQ